jgi:hypothetical protein
MPVKWPASRQASATSDDSSSGGNDRFVISPRPRRETRKASHGGEGSCSHTNEEATRIVEGRAVAAVREANASGIIQKVTKANFEYTLRRVDRRHARRPTDYTRGENQSMRNWNEVPYEWTTEFYDHRFLKVHLGLRVGFRGLMTDN